MSEVYTVLIIPEEGDPHGLLKWGPCGLRPATAHGTVDGRWFSSRMDAAKHHMAQGLPLPTNTQVALVMAWEGLAASDGLDRFLIGEEGPSTAEVVDSWIFDNVEDIPGQVVSLDKDWNVVRTSSGKLPPHHMRCGNCSQPFDMRDWDQVIAHEHDGPREVTGITGVEVKDEPSDWDRAGMCPDCGSNSPPHEPWCEAVSS